MNRLLLVLLALVVVLTLMFSSVFKPGPTGLIPVPPLAGDVPDDEFFRTNVLESKTPVLVDFNATWCGPCKALKPELEALEKNMAGRLKIVEIDVDENPDLAMYYRASSIPLVILFVDGAPVGGSVGLASAPELQKMIEPYLPAN
jgi:thioredoxin